MLYIIHHRFLVGMVRFSLLLYWSIDKLHRSTRLPGAPKNSDDSSVNARRQQLPPADARTQFIHESLLVKVFEVLEVLFISIRASEHPIFLLSEQSILSPAEWSAG